MLPAAALGLGGVAVAAVVVASRPPTVQQRAPNEDERSAVAGGRHAGRGHRRRWIGLDDDARTRRAAAHKPAAFRTKRRRGLALNMCGPFGSCATGSRLPVSFG